MCCETLRRRIARQLFNVPPPSFVIPIFRAPTTASTIKTTIETTTTNKLISAILKQENIGTNLSTDMISQRTFENLVLTNTIVAAFCIILMVTLTAFLIFLLIPSIRRRWLNDKQINEKQIDDLATLSRQQSFRHFTLGPSRPNPIFEQTTGGTTQFGAFYHPHTFLHPAVWTQMAPTSAVPTPAPTLQQQQQQQQIPLLPSAPPTPKTPTATNARPPLPSHPPTTVQRSPRKR
jgi:hypothetical protein